MYIKPLDHLTHCTPPPLLKSRVVYNSTMAKQKPYRSDGALTRQLMLENITQCLDAGILTENDSQQAAALFSFYSNPPGPGYQYSWNHIWVMSSEFNKLYRELEDLLHESIVSAKQTPTKNKRRVRAAQLTFELWIKGHHFDEEDSRVKIVPIPIPRKLTKADKALHRASIEATWRNGSRNSN